MTDSEKPTPADIAKGFMAGFRTALTCPDVSPAEYEAVMAYLIEAAIREETEALTADRDRLRAKADQFDAFVAALLATEPHADKLNPTVEALLDKMTEAKRLRNLLAPFVDAAAGIPNNWPGQCVLTWNDGWVDGHVEHYVYMNYLHCDAQGGPTINDYRAVAALSK